MKTFASVPLAVRWVFSFSVGAGVLKLFEFFSPLFEEADQMSFFAKAHYADLLVAAALFVAGALFAKRNRWSTRVLFWVFTFVAMYDARHLFDSGFALGSLPLVPVVAYFMFLISAIVALFSKSVKAYLG